MLRRRQLQSPLLVRRGGCVVKKFREATEADAAGVVAHKNSSSEATTPPHEEGTRLRVWLQLIPFVIAILAFQSSVRGQQPIPITSEGKVHITGENPGIRLLDKP